MRRSTRCWRHWARRMRPTPQPPSRQGPYMRTTIAACTPLQDSHDCVLTLDFLLWAAVEPGRAVAGECAGAAARRQGVPSRREAAGGARHGADAAGGCLAALRGRARPGQRAGLHPPRRCRWAPPLACACRCVQVGFPCQRLNHQTISRGSTCGVHRHVCKIKMYCELGDEVVVTSCRCSMCMHGQGGRRCSEACSACERAPPPRRLSAWHIRVSLIPFMFPGAAWQCW